MVVGYFPFRTAHTVVKFHTLDECEMFLNRSLSHKGYPDIESFFCIEAISPEVVYDCYIFTIDRITQCVYKMRLCGESASKVFEGTEIEDNFLPF